MNFYTMKQQLERAFRYFHTIAPRVRTTSIGFSTICSTESLEFFEEFKLDALVHSYSTKYFLAI